jgi:anti-sigma regulatory factor (Ser/Thr protein kinase)
VLTPALSLRLVAEPHAAAAARRAIADLEPTLGVAICDRLALLASELVTNTLRHAGLRPKATIGLEVRVDDRLVCACVTDPGPGFEAPTPPTPGEPREDGWGLLILDRIAKRWGINKRDGRTRVCFELERAA